MSLYCSSLYQEIDVSDRGDVLTARSEGFVGPRNGPRKAWRRGRELD